MGGAVGAHHAFDGHSLFHSRFLLIGYGFMFRRRRCGAGYAFQSGLPQPQAQCVGHHAHGTEGHTGGGDHGIEQQVQRWIQHARRHRDAHAVIKERPEQVLPDVPQHGPGQLRRRGHVREAALHQHDIRRLNGDIGARADGKAHVRLHQRRGVIDAVAHHGHQPALLLQPGHAGGLVLGQHLRDHLIHPHLTGDGVGGPGIVAGQQHHAAAPLLQGGDGGGAVGLDGVRHGDKAQQTALFGKVQHRLAVIGPPARLRGKGGDIHALFLHIGGVSGIDGSVMEKGLHTAAGHGGEVRHITQGNVPLAGGLRYGPAERMLAGLLHAGRHAQQFLLRDIRSGKAVGETGLALGDGAGLVQHHRIHTAHQLQRLGGFDQNTVFRRLAGAYHDGHGRGKAQSAGAGDHQHGNAHRQAELHAHAAHQPPQQRREHRDGHDHRHEHAADLIGQPGDGRLTGGGLLHQLHDLGQGGVRPHTGGLQLQIAALIDGGGGDGIAHRLFHRQALAGDGGFVHGAAAGGDDAVHGDLAPLTHHHDITLTDVLRGNGNLRAVPLHHGTVRRQRQQGGDGVGGLALAALLQIFAHGHQRADHARRLKVQLRHTGHLPRRQTSHFDETVYQSRAGAQRHQRVHIGAAAEQLGKAHGEIASVQDQDGHAQHQLRQGVGQVAAGQEGGQRQAHHVAHTDIKQRHKIHNGPHQTAAHSAQGLLLCPAGILLFRIGRRLRAVAAVFHRRDDGLRRHLRRVVVHQHGAQHQVHRHGIHALQLADRLFHMGRAGRAGHAGHHKFFLHYAAPLLHQFLQRGHQFVDDPVVPLPDAVRHAGADMGGQQLLAEAVQRRGDGGHLHQNIRAVGVLLQHLPQAPHLSLNAAEAVGQAFLLLRGAVFRFVLAASAHVIYLLGVSLDSGII